MSRKTTKTSKPSTKENANKKPRFLFAMEGRELENLVEKTPRSVAIYAGWVVGASFDTEWWCINGGLLTIGPKHEDDLEVKPLHEYANKPLGDEPIDLVVSCDQLNIEVIVGYMILLGRRPKDRFVRAVSFAETTGRRGALARRPDMRQIERWFAAHRPKLKFKNGINDLTDWMEEMMGAVEAATEKHK